MISAGDIDSAHMTQQGQHQPVCVTIQMQYCKCVCVYLCSYLCENQFESSTWGVRTFLESKDILVGFTFGQTFIGLFEGKELLLGLRLELCLG